VKLTVSQLVIRSLAFYGTSSASYWMLSWGSWMQAFYHLTFSYNLSLFCHWGDISDSVFHMVSPFHHSVDQYGCKYSERRYQRLQRPLLPKESVPLGVIAHWRVLAFPGESFGKFRNNIFRIHDTERSRCPRMSVVGFEPTVPAFERPLLLGRKKHSVLCELFLR
jgi:hypothetical protein